MFVNLSNHPSVNWSDKQLAAAHEYGEIVDMEFPPISVNSSMDDVMRMAKEYLHKLQEMKPDVIFCAGEFCMTFVLVDVLKKNGFHVINTYSGRETVEVKNPDGTTTKTSHFSFKFFRDYEYYYDPDEK